MKLIPINNDENCHNKDGKSPEPPAVTINGTKFSLNNAAAIGLARIFGGSDYGIQLYVSECLDYVGFGVKPSDKVLSAPVKSVSSRKVKDMLNLKIGVLKFDLVNIEGVLVADVSKSKQPIKSKFVYK
ncbi:hypothetical protein OTK49_20850 [Vibrio coralliirubri]|uniref:hypothetical protein n=1 Tax=Vibrio coralliirubri TaxID=1516159 RepID=UPI0022841C20|nr:hypothetical protein [Vibrio coralliirubri]MCY9864968.1 hypothetical protein [Vibrio coralliirubri]